MISGKMAMEGEKRVERRWESVEKPVEAGVFGVLGLKEERQVNCSTEFYKS